MRRPLIWTGVALSIVSVVLYIVSLCWSFAWLGTTRTYIVAQGVLWTAPMSFAPAGFRPGFRVVQPAASSWEFDLGDLGPGYRLSMGRPQPGARYVALWALPAIAAPLTLGLWLLRRRPGLDACTNCRYDLRGTPKGDDGSRRCPECGTISDPEEPMKPIAPSSRA